MPNNHKKEPWNVTHLFGWPILAVVTGISTGLVAGAIYALFQLTTG